MSHANQRCISSEANCTRGCNARLVSEFLWLSPATALTTGSTINSDAPPASLIASRNGSMSRAGSNERAFPSCRTAVTKSTRERSASAAMRRGTSVSDGSSSPDQITTRPGVEQREPSGQTPLLVTVAANDSAMVVFPVPGAPPRMCGFPFANQPRQSHEIGSGRTKSALMSSTFAADGCGFALGSSACRRPTGLACR